MGSILGWGLRTAVENLAFVGALFVRALPVVLLTVLVFFNTYVWAMASTISRPRLWLALMFLGAHRGRVHHLGHGGPGSTDVVGIPPRRGRRRAAGRHAVREDARPRIGAHRCRGPERINVVFVLATSQVLQVGLVAIVAGLIFFVLGLILLSPELLAQWTRNGPSDGQILGMTLPVPQSLIQISMFLARDDVHVHQRARRRRHRLPIPIPRPAHRRPAPDAGRPEPLPGGRRAR